MYATITRLIACEDCGYHYETIRHNTKRDSVCQLIRSISYIASRRDGGKRQCALCSETFLPLDTGDHLCAEHTPVSKRPGRGTCSYCHEDKPFCRVDVSVCLSCAQDPGNRERLYRALVKKQERRRGTEYGPLPAQEPWPEKRPVSVPVFDQPDVVI